MRALVFLRLLVACEAPLLVACEAPREAPVDRAARAVRAGEIVLDARPDGSTLIARELALPEGTDGPRRLSVRHVEGGVSKDVGVVSDARLLDRGLLVVRPNGDLERVADDGAIRAIDREVFGPLSVKNGKAAYVRGEPPSLEVFVVEIDGGSPIALTTSFAPTWCPAIADDGAVLFVTGRDGAPALARAKIGEPTRILSTKLDVVPEGATFAIGDALLFEAERGLRVVGLDGRLRRSIERARAPVVVANGLLFMKNDEPRRMPLSEVLR